LQQKVHEVGVGQQSRYEALQQVSGVIVAHSDLNSVLEDLARFLPSVVNFEFLGVALHIPERHAFRLYAFGGFLDGGPEIETEIPEGIARGFVDAGIAAQQRDTGAGEAALESGFATNERAAGEFVGVAPQVAIEQARSVGGPGQGLKPFRRDHPVALVVIVTMATVRKH